MNPLFDDGDYGDGEIGTGTGDGGHEPERGCPNDWLSRSADDGGGGYGDGLDGYNGDGWTAHSDDDLIPIYELHDTLQPSVMLAALLPLLRYPHASELRHARVAVHFPLDGS